jgi:hypothetical protein
VRIRVLADVSSDATRDTTLNEFVAAAGRSPRAARFVLVDFAFAWSPASARAAGQMATLASAWESNGLVALTVLVEGHRHGQAADGPDASSWRREHGGRTLVALDPLGTLTASIGNAPRALLADARSGRVIEVFPSDETVTRVGRALALPDGGDVRR